MNSRRRPRFSAATASREPPAIGIDEAGRGCLIGPVVAAAVFFDPSSAPAEMVEALDDSKKLSHSRRAEAELLIRRHCAIGVAARSARSIDRLGIRRATLEAMRDAWEIVTAYPHVGRSVRTIIDGVDVPPGLEAVGEAITGADASKVQAAAASIMAKAMKTRISRIIDRLCPGYGIAANEGYGTREHLDALRKHGPSRHHRMSWSRTKQGELDL